MNTSTTWRSHSVPLAVTGVALVMLGVAVADAANGPYKRIAIKRASGDAAVATADLGWAEGFRRAATA